jgi:hydroxylaminobenzene mutase
MKQQKRRLMWHGMVLFLLGLVTGLFEQRFTNVRMGKLSEGELECKSIC